MFLVENIILICVIILIDNIFQLDKTTDTCEEDKSGHVSNVGSAESVHGLRVEIKVLSIAENRWESAEFLANAVHH